MSDDNIDESPPEHEESAKEDDDPAVAKSEDEILASGSSDEESDVSSQSKEALEEESRQLFQLEERNRELEETLLRAQAESDNVRKRAAKDVQLAHKFGAEKFVKEILPLKDSLELGLDSAKNSTDIAPIVEGFSLTLKMFVDVLGRLEIEELDPLGESFDPEKHQAMTTEYMEGKPSGIVLRVFQKGYLLHERLVRPALVVVSTDKAEDSTEVG